MVDFTSTQAQAKETAPPASRDETQTMTVVTKSPSASPPLTMDRVDRMYHQLAKIHAIITMQLAECAHWRPTNSTRHLAQAGTSRPRPNMAPSTVRLTPSPLWTSCLRPHYGNSRDDMMSLRLATKLTRGAQVHCLGTASRDHKVNRVTFCEARSRSHSMSEFFAPVRYMVVKIAHSCSEMVL
jgi:hypothetical protein